MDRSAEKEEEKGGLAVRGGVERGEGRQKKDWIEFQKRGANSPPKLTQQTSYRGKTLLTATRTSAV